MEPAHHRRQASKIDADMSDGRYKGEHVGWSQLANVTIDESTGDIMVFAAGLKPADALYRSRNHGNPGHREDRHPRRQKRMAGHDPAAIGITLSHGKHKGRLLIPSQVFVGSINKDGSRTYLNKGQGRKYFAKRYSNALYSDDSGRTWTPSDPFPILGTSEPGLLEMTDGSIYYNAMPQHPATKSLAQPRRRQSWAKAGEDDELFDGPPDDYGCKGAILRCHSKTATFCFSAAPVAVTSA